MTDFEIITNPRKFEEIKWFSICDQKAFEKAWNVHKIFVEETWLEMWFEEFISQIWSKMDEWWNWAFKPRTKDCHFHSEPWKWQDSLSVILLWIKWMTREKYQKIMASTQFWYLDKFYVTTSGRLNSASN
ncbi:MAG: hypothetical protein ACD_2C00224G0001 [uncultured bacterium (gcode 4)]|uniref:Uncharacterized protein n=1 Tax=uncultured bacterium (gcode 4) TaxID=1234023 RepID=K2G1Q6_9BACT|nr:MAG: hypothetical protein ACD_2C00224G0001 [uncultured bacterium (gcode 4)]